MVEELGPLYNDGFMVYHALLKTEVRVKVGVVACPNDSRAHEKLAWVNPSGAKVCCWLCNHHGSHESQYQKVMYHPKPRCHLPAGHPWRNHPFFGQAAAAARPDLRTTQAFIDDADQRERYLEAGGTKNGANDPCKTTGVKGYAEIWRLPGMEDPERLPADFMHSVSLLASGLTKMIKGQVLKGKKATKGDLYDVETRGGGSSQSQSLRSRIGGSCRMQTRAKPTLTLHPKPSSKAACRERERERVEE